MRNQLTKTLTVAVTMLLIVTSVKAADWKNISNFSSITHITVQGNNVWVAAKGGLMKYDQVSGTKTFFEKGPGKLPSLSVERVVPNMITGDIWIGTYDNGIASFNGSTWQSYPYPDPGTLLYEMKMEPNGTIWCATTRGIYKFVNGTYSVYLPNGHSSASAAWDIELLPGGKLLCAGNEPFIYTPATNNLEVLSTSTFAYSDSKVYIYNDSTYYYASDHGDVAKFVNGIEVDTFHTPGVVEDMQRDAFGNMMILTTDKRLYTLYNGHTFIEIPDATGYTNAFAIAANGDLWEGVASYSEANLLHKNPQFTVESINLKQYGLHSNWVRNLKPTLDGNLMVISQFGLQKYNIQQGAFVDQWQIENQPNIEDAIELNGKLYAATPNNYLSVYENGTWTELGQGVLPSHGVDYMDVDANGHIWLAGPNYIAHYDGANFTVFTASNGGPSYLNGLYARDIHCDKTRNKVYVATFQGIIEYSNDVFTLHMDTNTQGIMQYYDAINTISEDAEHNIYFGTIYGAIIKYDGTTYTSWLLPEHVGNQSITDIDFMGDKMFVSDNLHGIWIYENNQWDSLNTRNSALTSNYVTSMLVDANNNLWAGNLSYGLDVYNKTGVVLSVDETQPSVEAVVFPNPSTSVFNVQLKNEDEMDITVSNLSGQTVKQIKANANAVIDLSNNPKGLYIATIATKAGTKNIKLSFH